ncbi:MAG: DUF87 domain-containing protein [Proteobacteria bacterium]|nr:MAG: DUF87 domain-containing protein [Pseudomonadota bacterium]
MRYTDRLSHIYIIGKTGTGKTTLLESLIMQDIRSGKGVTLIDPHGDYVERIAASVPSDRADDVLYFNVPDATQPYGYNPLKFVADVYRPLAASGILEVFKKMWAESWGQRLEHILRNALLALLDTPGATLPDILRLLADRTFRRSIAAKLSNERVKDYWLVEYQNYSPRLRAEAIVPIQNRVGAFLADPVLHRVLTTPEKPIQVRRIMDEERILLVNLSKGQIGEDASGLLGGLLVTTLGLAAYSRADTSEIERTPHYLFVDEFQNFTTLAIANMVSELRKYGVAVVLANQYLSQLEPEIRDAVLGNAGTLISFRLGAKDAPVIAGEFDPNFSATDLVNLENHHIYRKMMIDGAPSIPFSATTLTPRESRMRQDIAQLKYKPASAIT